jgi:hypothetical protein
VTPSGFGGQTFTERQLYKRIAKVPLHIGDQVCFTDLLVALIAASFERSAASSNLSGLSFEIDVVYDRYKKLPLATARSWEHILHSYRQEAPDEPAGVIADGTTSYGHVDLDELNRFEETCEAHVHQHEPGPGHDHSHSQGSFTSNLKAVFASFRGHQPVNTDDDNEGDDDMNGSNDYGDWSPPECRSYLTMIRHTTHSPALHPMENVAFDGKLLTISDQIVTLKHHRCIMLVQRAVRRKLKSGSNGISVPTAANTNLDRLIMAINAQSREKRHESAHQPVSELVVSYDRKHRAVHSL